MGEAHTAAYFHSFSLAVHEAHMAAYSHTFILFYFTPFHFHSFYFHASPTPIRILLSHLLPFLLVK
jgi:hypothetical protein